MVRKDGMSFTSLVKRLRRQARMFPLKNKHLYRFDGESWIRTPDKQSFKPTPTPEERTAAYAELCAALKRQLQGPLGPSLAPQVMLVFQWLYNRTTNLPDPSLEDLRDTAQAVIDAKP
jgi:hypothetical protein